MMRLESTVDPPTQRSSCSFNQLLSSKLGAVGCLAQTVRAVCFLLVQHKVLGLYHLCFILLFTVKLNYIQRACTFVHLFVFQRNVLNLGNQKHTYDC